MIEPTREALPDGTVEYRVSLGSGHTVLHRLDGPAVVRPDGTEEWWEYGQKHRFDGPAVVRANGAETWYLHDRLHRLGGPAVTKPDGYEGWYEYGQLHREDGVAMSRPDGFRAYSVRGQYHRFDGPAIYWVDPDGRIRTPSWRVYGAERRDLAAEAANKDA